MRKKCLIFTIFLATFFGGVSQFTFPVCGARSSALGGNTVALSDFWSAMDNVAGLTNISSFDIGVAFSNNFALAELSSKTVAIASPLSKTNAIGLKYTHIGSSLYFEQMIALEFAQMIGQKISLGIELDYLNCGTSDVFYDEYHLFTFATAIRLYPSKNLVIGFYVFNPTSIAANNDYSQYVPAIMKLGTEYQITPDFAAYMEIEKNMLAKECVKTGVEYRFFKHFYARVGFASNPMIYSFGIGVEHNEWFFDFSSQVHTALGISPSISMHHSF